MFFLQMSSQADFLNKSQIAMLASKATVISVYPYMLSQSLHPTKAFVADFTLKIFSMRVTDYVSI